ncbi:MAG: response regulator, partial [Candidatus Aminicenantales bacterium]
KAVVIDDDKVTVAIVSQILAADGFEVVSAADGAAGLECVYREKPDLVVTDLLIPRVDGVGVCAKIKADPGLTGVKLVIMTALKNFAFQHEARNSGADIVLEKPISVEMLKAALDRLFPGP